MCIYIYMSCICIYVYGCVYIYIYMYIEPSLRGSRADSPSPRSPLAALLRKTRVCAINYEKRESATKSVKLVYMLLLN